MYISDGRQLSRHIQQFLGQVAVIKLSNNQNRQRCHGKRTLSSQPLRKRRAHQLIRIGIDEIFQSTHRSATWTAMSQSIVRLNMRQESYGYSQANGKGFFRSLSGWISTPGGKRYCVIAGCCGTLCHSFDASTILMASYGLKDTAERSGWSTATLAPFGELTLEHYDNPRLHRVGHMNMGALCARSRKTHVYRACICPANKHFLVGYMSCNAVLARRHANHHLAEQLGMIHAADHDHVIDLLSEYIDGDEDEWMKCSLLISAVRQRASVDSKSGLKQRWVALTVSAVQTDTVIVRLPQNKLDAHVTIGTWFVNDQQARVWDDVMSSIEEQLAVTMPSRPTRLQHGYSWIRDREYWTAAWIQRNCRILDQRKGEVIYNFCEHSPAVSFFIDTEALLSTVGDVLGQHRAATGRVVFHLSVRNRISNWDSGNDNSTHRVRESPQQWKCVVNPTGHPDRWVNQQNGESFLTHSPGAWRYVKRLNGRPGFWHNRDRAGFMSPLGLMFGPPRGFTLMKMVPCIAVPSLMKMSRLTLKRFYFPM